jgi:hypothetical protein
MQKETIQRLALPAWESLLVAGLSRDADAAKKTARNLIHRGRFPFPLCRIGTKNLVLVKDLFAALGIEREGSVAHVAEPSRGRGRPRKTAKEVV